MSTCRVSQIVAGIPVFPPRFKIGDPVRHRSGSVGTVQRCRRGTATADLDSVLTDDEWRAHVEYSGPAYARCEYGFYCVELRDGNRRNRQFWHETEMERA